jgi:hypothetical protein
LGVFSGITTSCCAPVLVGVITLSALSPTTLQSLGVGLSYVFGMVAPLYVASIFIEKRNILEKPILRQKLGVIRLGSKQYPIFVSNLIAASIFSVTGLLTIILSSVGMLGMPTGESPIIKTIQNTATTVTKITSSIPGINATFALIGGYLLYRFLKSTFKRK